MRQLLAVPVLVLLTLVCGCSSPDTTPDTASDVTQDAPDASGEAQMTPEMCKQICETFRPVRARMGQDAGTEEDCEAKCLSQ